MPYLKALNPLQREAVTFDGGPLLILAGAGSGKTRVLTTRISHLIQDGNISPERILAVTFTNKAAGEMKERINSLIGEKAKGLWLGTFHSIGLRILRAEGRHIGITDGFNITVYNDDDQISLIKQIMKELGLNDKTFSPRAVLSRINMAKNENLSPQEYLADGGDFFTERTGSIYSLYQRKLREMNALDFGDLICEPIRLFKQHPQILESYQNRFLHVLVDEYQDTNRSQYILLNMLSQKCGNICTVGDPDQSIYAWRGADIRNILDFEKDYSESTILKLEQNYRSTKNILAAANSVIKNNDSRLDKNLWTDNDEGEKITYARCRDEHHEASTVVEEIKLALSSPSEPKLNYSDFAVFYRTNSQSRVFEEHLMRSSIPYALIGGFRFYERKEIRDAITYLRVLINPKDSISFQRIINTPPRGIGKATMDSLWEITKETGCGLYDAFKIGIERKIVKKPKALELLKAMEDIKKDIAGMEIHEAALRLLEDVGYMGMYIDENTEEALGRIENLHELVTAIKDFEMVTESPTLGEFLDQVSLTSDTDSLEDKTNKVTLMTAHSAKGLEFDTVFMVGLEEGLFPHSRSMDSEKEIEEERRLCYVGMTRAKRKLSILSADTRRVYGEPRYQMQSRFIDEIDLEFINIKTDTNTGSFYSDSHSKDSYRDPDYDYQSEFAGSSKPPGKSSVNDNDTHYTMDNSQLDPYNEENLSTLDEAPSARFYRGMKVKHKNFGLGIIGAIEGSGDSAKLTVKFQNSGVKKLVAKYAGLEVVF